ncbi:MAG TPA: DUF1634 domain-containing protein [Stellaceae bacterium]|jgi:uncharacterized membrane protein|nr:DUF1634 domain-containing protein [Stellaceae bacterium]
MTGTTTERRLELRIAHLLRSGTYVGCLAIGLGLILSWFDGGHTARLGQDIVAAGIALFILLPVLRVTLMLAAFLKQRDAYFAMAAGIVLAVIIISCAVGWLMRP